MQRIIITAETAAEASAIYSGIMEASGEGASTFPDGEWSGNRISYNGKVWAGLGEWRPGDQPIYNPYASAVAQ